MIVIAWVVEISCVINKIISDRLRKEHEAEKKTKRNEVEYCELIEWMSRNETWIFVGACFYFSRSNVHTSGEIYICVLQCYLHAFCVYIFAFIYIYASLFSLAHPLLLLRFEWVMRRVYQCGFVRVVAWQPCSLKKIDLCLILKNKINYFLWGDGYAARIPSCHSRSFCLHSDWRS